MHPGKETLIGCVPMIAGAGSCHLHYSDEVQEAVEGDDVRRETRSQSVGRLVFWCDSEQIGSAQCLVWGSLRASFSAPTVRQTHQFVSGQGRGWFRSFNPLGREIRGSATEVKWPVVRTLTPGDEPDV